MTGSLTKKYAGIALGVVLLAVLGLWMPTPAGMSPGAQRVLGIVAFLLCVWIFDSFPIGMGSAFALILLPLMGILPIDETLQQFMRPATFFVITTYALATAMACTPLAARILRKVIRLAGKGTERLVLALMISTALMSTIMSNVANTAIMMSVTMKILRGVDAQPGNSRLGRTLMIAVPVASMCGGIATPAGSSLNVLAIGLLNTATGTTISFFDWMIIGLPLCVVLLPICWFVLVRMFKPEPIPDEVIAPLISDDAVPKKMTAREWRALSVILITITLWIAGSWLRFLDMTLVATISMLLFFLPGMDVFKWEDFTESISWEAVFTVGSVMALGYAVVNTGMGAWIVNAFFSGAGSWSPLLMMAVLALFVNFIHIILPVAPAIVTIVLPPMLILAAEKGFSAAAVTMIVAIMASCVMLLPIDTLTVMTYSKRYYTIPQMFRSGIIMSCIWAIVAAAWVYLCTAVF